MEGLEMTKNFLTTWYVTLLVLLFQAEEDYKNSLKPVTAEVLSVLPTKRFKADAKSGIKTSEEFQKCNICMEDYSENEEIVSLPCCHQYHYDCM